MALCVAVSTILSLLALSGSQSVAAQGAFPHVTHNSTVVQGGGGVCPSADRLTSTKANITGDIRALLNKSVLCNCEGPGWTRIAYLNMTDPTQNCPVNWKLIDSPKRSCGRLQSTNSSGCNSANFSAQGLQYSQVCGKVIGYQVGAPDAFGSETGLDIESYYVEGVSITHGNPRVHIWTFAAAYDEYKTNKHICPCTNSDALDTAIFNIPFFVGEDYFCETGVPPDDRAKAKSAIFYPDDPLWDGVGCGPKSSCCTFNNPPWFCKQLPQATGDDIEARICAATQPEYGENTPVELLEIYVR